MMESSPNPLPVTNIDPIQNSPEPQQELVISPIKNNKIAWIIVTVLTMVFIGVLYYTYRTQMDAPEVDDNPYANVSTVFENNKLRVGTDATFPPMEYMDEQGNIIGHDVDLIQAIATELGVQTNVKNINWDDIFDSLVNDEIDIILSSVTINEERQQLYDFTEPYLNAGQVIITRKDNTSISSPGDLSNKKIAVQRGTTNETEALKYTGQELVLLYDDFEAATQALVDGTADAIFSDLTGAKGITETYKNLKIASAPFTSDYYGVVVKKGNAAVLDLMNQALSNLRKKGVLTSLKQKWLE